MNGFFIALAQGIKKNRIFVLIFIILVNLFLALQLPSLEIDNSLNVWFAKEDPALKAYIQFKKQFGNDEVIITSLEFKEPLKDYQPIRKLKMLQDSIEKIKGVSHIMSIRNIPVGIKNNVPLTLGDYLDQTAPDEQSFDILRHVQEYKTTRRFYAQDFKFLVFYTWLDTLPDIEQRRKAIHDQVNEQIEQAFPESVQINQSGPGIIYDTLNRETLAVVPFIMGVSYLLVLLLVFLFTRKIRWVIITFLAISFSNISLFGLMALFGSKPNMVTMAIPPLIIVVGVANIIHFAKGIENIRLQAFDENSSQKLVAFVLKPLLFNALTTAGGFASLSVASLQVTREYGIYASLGVIIAFLHSLLLSLCFSGKTASLPVQNRFIAWVEDRIVQLMLYSATHRRLILLSSVVVLVVFGLGIFRIEADTNTTDFFQKNHPIQKQIDVMQRQLGYFYPADFLVSYKDQNWKSKVFLEKLSRLQAKIDSDTLFGKTFSIADLLNDGYALMSGSYHPAPETFKQLSQSRLISLSRAIQKSEYYAQLVTDGGKTIRLSVTGPIESASTYIMLTSYFEQTAREIFGEGLVLKPAGNLPLYSQSIRYTMHDQLTSLSLAIFIILLLIGLLLRSVRLSFLAIPSNLIPIVFILGIMGYFNIRLDLATVTIAAAILGIIVDDTIHLLYGYKKLVSEEKTHLDLIRHLAQRKGPALVFTSIILCSGFIVIGLAGLRSIARPGWLIALAIFVALITDLFLMPALLVKPGKEKQ